MPATEPLYVPQAIEKAKRLAREKGYPFAVIEIDSSYDSRRVVVCPNDYTYTAEYEAFDGVLIAECHPDGDVW
jgi:hypothetical protein